MTVNFKITSWESVNVPEQLENEVLAALENEEIRTSEDLIQFLRLNSTHSAREAVFGSETQMTVSENGGQPTVFATLNGESRPIFTNETI